MSVMRTLVVAVLLAPPLMAQQTLDFEAFRDRVQPIFLKKRPGHARCYVCHSQATPFRLQRLSPGAATWDEEQSRKNFDRVRRLVRPGNPNESRLLWMPLAAEAGGILVHSGGKHWSSQDDPEWRTLEEWVRSATAAPR